MNHMRARYFIGLPQWHHPGWHESVLGDSDPNDALRHYAGSFSSVEGNTTFYGLPTEQAVHAWRDQVPDDFRFCFKFPREISHGDGLLSVAAQRTLEQFLLRLEILQGSIGQLWLQLPASFSPSRLGELEQFIGHLPAGIGYAVEVRHPGFFDRGKDDRTLNAILVGAGVNRVSFDTRALFAHPATDRITQEAWQQKPRLPLRVAATAASPMARIITPLELALGDTVIDEWVERVVGWLVQGREPYLFFHTPDNQASPQLAARFSERLQQKCLMQGVEADGFSPWPEPVRRQPGLFS